MKKMLEKIDSILLFLLGLVVWASAANAEISEKGRLERYVLSIGANNGGSGRVLLRYAQSDARSFSTVMLEMGGVAKENLFLMTEPSVDELLNTMRTLDKKLQKSANGKNRKEVLVYYSGHADEKGIRLGSEIYGWQKFRERISSLHADVKIAVIDACGSGAITRIKGGVAVPAFMVDASSDMKGYAFITSSTQDESSQESDRLNGSFFTHSLVSAMRGAGDLSGDGKVTLSEAYQFAFNETLQKTQSTIGGAQHPSRDMNLVGTGDVVMTDLRNTSSGISLDRQLEGRLFVRDSCEILVAELYKKSGRPMELGLPEGSYKLILEQPKKHLALSVALAKGMRKNIGIQDFQPANLEKTVLRGEIKSRQEDSIEISLDSLDKNGRYRVTFNFIDVEDKPRKGLQLGIVGTNARDYLLGSQLGIVGNIADKDIRGFQGAGIFNLAKRNLLGLQIGTVNIAASFDGAQFGTLNMTKKPSRGAQIGVLNLSADSVNGAQVSTLNIAKTSSVQIGVLNVAESASVQVSVMNVAKKSDVQASVFNIGKNAKRQVGLMNVSSHASKRMIGLFNICLECEETPIGLLNFVGNGLWEASFGLNEMGGTAVNFKFGTAYFYTVVETARLFKEHRLFERYDNVWENGFGFGTHFGKYGNHVELEYAFFHVTEKYHGNYSLVPNSRHSASYHHRLRLGMTSRLFSGIGISAGISLNLASEGYADEIRLEPLGKWHDDFSVGGHRAKMWPGLYAGIVFGKF